jgi:DNA-damage-inducible protein J
MDEILKKQAESFFNELGMSITTAITVFIKAALRQGKIPFELEVDQFWSEANQARLVEATRRFEEGGHTVTKSFDELKAMENE